MFFSCDCWQNVNETLKQVEREMLKYLIAKIVNLFLTILFSAVLNISKECAYLKASYETPLEVF